MACMSTKPVGLILADLEPRLLGGPRPNFVLTDRHFASMATGEHSQHLLHCELWVWLGARLPRAPLCPLWVLHTLNLPEGFLGGFFVLAKLS